MDRTLLGTGVVRVEGDGVFVLVLISQTCRKVYHLFFLGARKWQADEILSRLTDMLRNAANKHLFLFKKYTKKNMLNTRYCLLWWLNSSWC